jgi:molybdopterin synthase sulfur carrier subunit
MRMLFLGRLEDMAEAAHIDFPLSAPTPLADLLVMLPPFVAEALEGPKVRLAVNGTLATRDGLILTDGDELAFLPPVSGG